MATCSPVFEEAVSEIARQNFSGSDVMRMEPVSDPVTGEVDGLLVESSLERVVVFSRTPDLLSLGEISRLRRALGRVQARRALLYVPGHTIVTSSVMLLATLSKIKIVRLAVAES
ncbi:MAG: hypothetical protein ACREI3_11405 [Nitrospirales bacterium]